MNRLLASVFVAFLLGGIPVSAAAELVGLDRYLIRQVIRMSFIGLDNGGEGSKYFASSFTSDGIYVDLDGKTYKGYDALVRFGELETRGGDALPKGATNPSHFVSNELVSMAPYGALALTDVLIAINRKDSVGSGAQISLALRCRDELVKTAAGWRIRKRTVSLD